MIDVTLLSSRQSLLDNIFSPHDISDLWMRTFTLLIFISAGFYSRHLLIKNIELDKILIARILKASEKSPPALALPKLVKTIPMKILFDALITHFTKPKKMAAIELNV